MNSKLIALALMAAATMQNDRNKGFYTDYEEVSGKCKDCCNCPEPPKTFCKRAGHHTSRDSFVRGCNHFKSKE